MEYSPHSHPNLFTVACAKSPLHATKPKAYCAQGYLTKSRTTIFIGRARCQCNETFGRVGLQRRTTCFVGGRGGCGQMGRDCVLDNSTIGDITRCVNIRGGRRDCETDESEDESEWASKAECVHIWRCSSFNRAEGGEEKERHIL